MNNTLTLNKRSSGILLHPSSLPGPHGIGDLGPDAYRFVDFLAKAGQQWWQILPMGPLGPSFSPYQAYSVFAGNPLFLSLELFVEEGWLTPAEISMKNQERADRVKYKQVHPWKTERSQLAYERFNKSIRVRQRNEFRRFCLENRNWLDDYALFMALKQDTEGAPWWTWDKDLRSRKSQALSRARKALVRTIQFHKFLQFQFFKQWNRLKTYARHRNIGVIGDVPIFVAQDSADVWIHQQLFRLDASGRPLVVAGVPPDYFSKDGQRWENPIYRWNVLRRLQYKWWLDRLRVSFKMFDVVRLDHFIGFYRYWAVPAEAPTARTGRWEKGPAAHFFESVFRSLGPCEFIAEDLGVVTKAVKELRDRFDLPGMKVLQFAFGNDPEAENYQPHNYPKRCVAYTGTHDNDTTVGWFRDRGSKASTRSRADIQKERRFALYYLNSSGREIHWDMIRLALMSPADTVIIPAQDLLGLGPEARMNLPGTPDGNWRWRLKRGMLNDAIAKRLQDLTAAFGRAI